MRRVLRAEQCGDSDRGAVIVEFALVSIILVILLFGIIEGGLLFRAKLSLGNAVDEGTRRGAIVGNDPFADYYILKQIELHAPLDAITTVVVYKAPALDSPPPAACKTASSSVAECNYYTKADFSRSRSDFGTCAGLDGAWCPATRDNSLRTGDLVGVWIRGKFDSPSGIFKTFQLGSYNVQPLESRGL